MSRELRQLALQRPRVRVNQVGYLPTGPKLATVISSATEQLPFAVRGGDGRARLVGFTTVWPSRDPSSGFPLHLLDFNALGSQPDAVHITVGEGDAEIKSHPFEVADGLYDGLLADALLFFYAQRSGAAIDDAIRPGYGRPAGHVGALPNMGDTAVPGWSGPNAEQLYPGWHLSGRVDVSGGWYDAGDHGKYVVSGGLSAALLLSAHEETADGTLGRLPGADLLAPTMLDEAMWEVDWLVRMQVPPGEMHPGMAFHRVHDDHWTAFPMAPHDDPAQRVLHRPSTAATLNLAAVAAQAARVLRDREPRRAQALLTRARSAYAAAQREPLLLAPDDRSAHGGGPYNDDDVRDEFYWAASELYLTTGDSDVLEDVLRSPCHRDDVFDVDGFECEQAAAWVRLRLATRPSALPDRARVRESVLLAADRLAVLRQAQPWGQPYAPAAGWHWGSNGRLLTNIVVLATAFDIAGRRDHLDAAIGGVDYLFGRNGVGLSFVTGHGTETAHRQRVRHFAGALDPRCPMPPAGSLAGGPASIDYPGFPGDPRFAGLPPQLCYADEPTSETTNDVCVRWNAALVWVVSWLARLGREQRRHLAAAVRRAGGPGMDIDPVVHRGRYRGIALRWSTWGRAPLMESVTALRTNGVVSGPSSSVGAWTPTAIPTSKPIRLASAMRRWRQGSAP